MTSQEVRTLAYAKSPKTSRRTTFQDELQAAVSARASKTTSDHFSYSDDFDEDDDEDDVFNELLKSRKKKADAFKAGKSKVNANNTFDLSDDKGKHGKTKKVSFLKSKRISFSSEEASESRKNEQPDTSVVGQNDHNNLISSQHSTSVSKYDTGSKNSAVEPVDPQSPTGSWSKSLSYTTSDDLLDMPLPLPSDGSVTETQGPEEKSNTFLEETFQAPNVSGPDITLVPSADIPTEREPPKPKPRQRTLGLRSHAVEKTPEETESQDGSRPQTSSASIPLSSSVSSNSAVRSCSPHWTEDDRTFSHSLSKSSSSKSEQSQLLTKSTIDSESRGGFISDNSKDRDGKYSTSFEEFHEDLGDHSNHSVAQLSHTQEKSFDTRSSSNSKFTQRPQSACSRKVESKYLGSLKVLDRKVSLHESPPETADSLRAAVYQEWLRKKKEKSQGNMQLKKKEQLLQEQKKKEEEAKKGDAVASYEAWKEGKAESLKAKAKEKQDKMRKEQRASEETEEKKQSAKQVFEKWKQEQNQLLEEKHRKQKEAEKKLQLKKQTKEEERKRASTSAFSRWSDKKKDVIHEKVTMERKEVRNKAEEERYMKEERDKMALEMYESWLVRKDLEQKRQREERRIKEILRDSPPPPWSPPNKTIGFRK